MKQLTAALIIEDKKLLLVHNVKRELRIEPPGGKREVGETLEECVIREAKEELGIDILPVELFGIYRTASSEGDFEVHMYISKIVGGIPSIQKKERQKVSCFGKYSYRDLNMLKEMGVLVPNLCSALIDLKKYLE